MSNDSADNINDALISGSEDGENCWGCNIFSSTVHTIPYRDVFQKFL